MSCDARQGAVGVDEERLDATIRVFIGRVERVPECRVLLNPRHVRVRFGLGDVLQFTGQWRELVGCDKRGVSSGEYRVGCQQESERATQRANITH
jgi:hypothetical protein